MLACSWKESFGIECPSCGMQRSFVALIHGDLLESLVLFPALLPLLSVFILTAIHLFKPIHNAPTWIVRLFALSAILMFGNWIVKLVVLANS